MIIYVSKDNEKLISCLHGIINSNEIQTITGVKHLKKFVLQEMKNLNNFEHIIIDITGITDTEDDIVDSIVAIKSMYSIRIIIVALGYTYGNSTLARLFNEGIYNFVTATTKNEQEKELFECISGDGKQYKDSIRFRQALQTNNSKDKVIIKKEYKKLKQCVTIGVVGSQEHIGTTTQSLLITQFLNNLQLNVCYIQANEKSDIEQIDKLFSVEKKENFISYGNIDMYSQDKTVNAIEKGYDFYIYDMGILENKDIDHFITKDIKIVVAGSKPWEQDNVVKIFNTLGVLKDINFIFNFTPELQQKALIKNMGVYGVKTYFSKYAPNPFESDVNDEIYHKIFKDFIAEKSSKIEVLSTKKKGIFSFFQRGNKN